VAAGEAELGGVGGGVELADLFGLEFGELFSWGTVERLKPRLSTPFSRIA